MLFGEYHRSGEEVATKAFLDSLDFFPITREGACSAGNLRRKWRQEGQTISFTDITIAAVAIESGLPLLTDNKKHFPMPEIELFPLPR